MFATCISVIELLCIGRDNGKSMYTPHIITREQSFRAAFLLASVVAWFILLWHFPFARPPYWEYIFLGSIVLSIGVISLALRMIGYPVARVLVIAVFSVAVGSYFLTVVCAGEDARLFLGQYEIPLYQLFSTSYLYFVGGALALMLLTLLFQGRIEKQPLREFVNTYLGLCGLFFVVSIFYLETLILFFALVLVGVIIVLSHHRKLTEWVVIGLLVIFILAMIGQLPQALVSSMTCGEGGTPDVRLTFTQAFGQLVE